MIKHTSYMIIAFLTLSMNMKAFQVNDLMTQGNELYQREDYTEAIEKYETILAQGYESAALYYNLGNAYFKIGKVGFSILNYERGLELSPGDEDIIYNLNIVRARTVDKIQEVPDIFISKWWDSFVTLFSSRGWLYSVSFFYIMLLVSIGFFLFSKNIFFRKSSVVFMISSFFALAFSVLLLVSQFNREKSNDYGILIDSVITVKTAPDDKAGDAFVIHEGIKFEIEDQLDQWAKIKLQDGKVGWLPQNSFESI